VTLGFQGPATAFTVRLSFKAMRAIVSILQAALQDKNWGGANVELPNDSIEKVST